MMLDFVGLNQIHQPINPIPRLRSGSRTPKPPEFGNSGSVINIIMNLVHFNAPPNSIARMPRPYPKTVQISKVSLVLFVHKKNTLPSTLTLPRTPQIPPSPSHYHRKEPQHRQQPHRHQSRLRHHPRHKRRNINPRHQRLLPGPEPEFAPM